MTDQPSLEDADRCAITFLTAVEHMANRDATGVLTALEGYTGRSGNTAIMRIWGLASVAAMITAHIMRQHFANQVPADGLWTIQALTKLPIEQAVDASALAAARVLVEHLNGPLGKGTEPAIDILAAHARQHGPDGVIALVIEIVNIGAHLWREGAFNPPREEKTA